MARLAEPFRKRPKGQPPCGGWSEEGVHLGTPKEASAPSLRLSSLWEVSVQGSWALWPIESRGEEGRWVAMRQRSPDCRALCGNWPSPSRLPR